MTPACVGPGGVSTVIHALIVADVTADATCVVKFLESEDEIVTFAKLLDFDNFDLRGLELGEVDDRGDVWTVLADFDREDVTTTSESELRELDTVEAAIVTVLKSVITSVIVSVTITVLAWAK